MPVCQVCKRRVDELHELPPAVITSDLVQTYEGGEHPTDIETCSDCLEGLMAGKPLP